MNRENHIEKDLKGNYLWINREGVRGDRYEERILRKQKIPGLIPSYEIEDMGEAHIVFRLEFRKSFLEQLENKRMKRNQMESFIKALIRVVQKIDEFLLDPSNLILEMEYIYESDQTWDFIYVPGYEEDFWHQMEKISEEWLNYVDYGDEKAVLWAYSFYEKVHGYRCPIEEFENILRLDKEVITKTLIEEECVEIIEGKREKQTKNQQIPWWQRWKKKKYRKHDKKEKEISEFFQIENTLEDTCPVLNFTEDFETPKDKVLTWIPMGDTQIGHLRFEKIPALIGREKDEADVWIQDRRVSRIHARLDYKDGNVVLVDMNSANGSYRNGERLKAGDSYHLHSGDIVKLADLEFICQWCS